MPNFRIPFLAVIYIASVPLSAAWGQLRQEQTELPPNDRYGDPLPRGAMARLGTIRFRQSATTLAYSPDGKVLASGGAGLSLWDAATGQLKHGLFRDDSFSCLAFSPDGKTVFVGDRLGLIDVATGKERKLQRVGGHFKCVAFSPDGRTMAAGESNGLGMLILWDVQTGRRVRQMEGHLNDITSVAFSSDGKTLASGSHDKTVRLWDVATGKLRHKLEGHNEEIHFVVFSPDGKFLASAGDDAVIRLWDEKTGKELQQLEGHDYPVYCLAVSRDGKLFASGAVDGSIRVWEMGQGNVKPLRQWTSPTLLVTSVAFSPDGKVLASVAGLDWAIRFWDPETGKEIHPPPGHSGPVESIRFLNGDRELISLGEDRKALLWDLSTGAERRRLFDAHLSPATGKHWNTSAVSPDGKLLAFGKHTVLRAKVDPIVHVWDTTKGEELYGLSNHKTALMSLAFSPDGHLLASGDLNGRMCLWDVGRQVVRWTKDFQGVVLALVFSPDGKQLVTYDDAGHWIRLWEVGTGKELRRWAHPHTRGNRLIFSPDGRFLASSDSGETTRVWSVDTGNEYRQVPFGPSCLAFSPSGRILAGGKMKWVELPDGSTNRVGTIHLWELASGQEIRSIENDQQSVGSLAFASNGRILASGGMNSTILLWDLAGGKAQPSTRLSEKELDRLWGELGDKAPIAYRSIWRLVATPGQAVTFLNARLQPVKPADPQHVTRLITDLDSNQFSVRDQASKELEDLAELAEPALRKVSEGLPSTEVRQRVGRLLQKLNAPVTASDRLRSVRAIEVLEQIGSAEARQVLRTVAQGDPRSRLTFEARSTLERLQRKK